MITIVYGCTIIEKYELFSINTKLELFVLLIFFSLFIASPGFQLERFHEDWKEGERDDEMQRYMYYLMKLLNYIFSYMKPNKDGLENKNF